MNPTTDNNKYKTKIKADKDRAAELLTRITKA